MMVTDDFPISLTSRQKCDPAVWTGQFPTDSTWIGLYLRKQAFNSDSWTWLLGLGVTSKHRAKNYLVDSILHLDLVMHWNFSRLSTFSSIINWIILTICACPSIPGWQIEPYLSFFFFFFAFSRAASTAYGGSQARGPVRAAAASLCQSHSNTGSKLRLRPAPQLRATPDP